MDKYFMFVNCHSLETDCSLHNVYMCLFLPHQKECWICTVNRLYYSSKKKLEIAQNSNWNSTEYISHIYIYYDLLYSCYAINSKYQRFKQIKTEENKCQILLRSTTMGNAILKNWNVCSSMKI